MRWSAGTAVASNTRAHLRCLCQRFASVTAMASPHAQASSSGAHRNASEIRPCAARQKRRAFFSRPADPRHVGGKGASRSGVFVLFSQCVGFGFFDLVDLQSNAVIEN